MAKPRRADGARKKRGQGRADTAPQVADEKVKIARAKSVKKLRAEIPRRLAKELEAVVNDKTRKAKHRLAMGKAMVRKEIAASADAAAARMAATRPQPPGVKGRSVTFHLPTQRWEIAPASARSAWWESDAQWMFAPQTGLLRRDEDALREFLEFGVQPQGGAAAEVAKRLGARDPTE